MASRPQPLGVASDGFAGPGHSPQAATVGNMEPRIEVLINRINEVQQAKKKAVEELGEAQTVWDTLQKELDSLHEEKVRMKEILSKK
uniref:Synaptonemal complex central element protein 1 n=1 Tax=Nannospalax galili TaxID=1026970 RepID=A0A8C6RHS5_NANGA